MPHIHTEPGQHDQTVAAYIFRTDGDEPRALFHVHKKFGKLICMGGHVELDETPWQAVIHEVNEESGYEVQDLYVLQPKLRVKQDGIREITIHPQPFFVDTHMNAATHDHWHTDQVYLFTTMVDPSGKPAEGEVQEVRWLTRDEVASTPASEMFENIRQTHLIAFDEFLDTWEPIAASEFGVEKIYR